MPYTAAVTDIIITLTEIQDFADKMESWDEDQRAAAVNGTAIVVEPSISATLTECDDDGPVPPVTRIETFLPTLYVSDNDASEIADEVLAFFKEDCEEATPGAVITYEPYKLINNVSR